jgi:P-type Ca2+ transporter type 2C
MNLDIQAGERRAGLSDKDVRARLQRDGPNELPSAKPRSILVVGWEVVRQPMFLLLVGCGLVYLIFGELQEALVLLAFVLVVMGITLYQERKTERALDALRDLSSPRALVIRDGARKRIPGRDVVVDDLIVLGEGDRVAADAIVIEAANLSSDESLLTGESVPVGKVAAQGPHPLSRAGGDDNHCVYSGSLIVQGQGIARVAATGVQTEIGRIGTALRTIQIAQTPLQLDTERLVKRVAIGALGLAALVVVIYGLTHGNWLDGVLAGIALAMALLPEEFPVVLTVFLALGAWRISQRNVLTRRMPALETLGAATVLCVDKTGTLTENRMTVRRLVTATGQTWDVAPHSGVLPETFHRLVEFAVLASHRDPFDPMERAINALGASGLADTEHLHNEWILAREYSLSPSLLAMSQVWQSRDEREFVVAAKGASEATVDLCHLDDAQRDELNRHVNALAEEGLRVLGVACARFQPGQLPSEQHDFDFEYLGLIGLLDPVRNGVPAAVSECHTAGIRVLMITGDYPQTAVSIARLAGFGTDDRSITGVDVNTMTDDVLRERIRSVNIVARALPEQKLRIVNALKANAEVVAMTGDGVNDAPALRAADIGIAMGGRGTDVAREAADLIVTDDNFTSIVQAVRLGRRIFNNLKKATGYIVAVHIPIAGTALLPAIFGWPLILLPAHIAFLELIIDPACSVVFEAEPEGPDVMRRPPRSRDESLYSRAALQQSLADGLSALACVLLVYLVARSFGYDDDQVRALTFITLVLGNLTLILSNRSHSRSLAATLKTRNPALWWVVGGTLLGLVGVLAVPFLRSAFRFSLPPAGAVVLCIALGGVLLLWLELHKQSIRESEKNRV